jgi:hypothetical protein
MFFDCEHANLSFDWPAHSIRVAIAISVVIFPHIAEYKQTFFLNHVCGSIASS